MAEKRYIKPSSLTFWAGAAMVSAGVVLELEPSGWDGIIAIIRSLTSMASGDLIAWGLAIIGGRRALDDLKLSEQIK